MGSLEGLLVQNVDMSLFPIFSLCVPPLSGVWLTTCSGPERPQGQFVREEVGRAGEGFGVCLSARVGEGPGLQLNLDRFSINPMALLVCGPLLHPCGCRLASPQCLLCGHKGHSCPLFGEPVTIHSSVFHLPITH